MNDPNPDFTAPPIDFAVPLSQMDKQLAALGVTPPPPVVAEAQPDPEDTPVSADKERTRRSALAIIALSLLAVALSTLGLLAFSMWRGGFEAVTAVAESTGAATLLVAIITGLGGLAAGVGIAKGGQ
jgi:hypothetical protein